MEERRQPEPLRGRRKRARAIAPGWLTLFSVLIAVVLWAISTGEREFTVELRLPLSYPRLSPGLVMLESPSLASGSVSVEFRGRGAMVLIDQYFRAPSSVAWSDASPRSHGPFPIRVVHVFAAEDLRFPGAEFTTLAVSSFNPPSVEITVDRSVTRMVPVRVPADGAMPERFLWTVLDRDSVILQGAESVLDTIQFVSSIAVDPSGNLVRVPLVRLEGVRNISPSELEAALVPPVPLVGLAALR